MEHFPQFWLALLVLTVTSTTVVGLAGIWIALGRGHWFVRVACVGAVLASLLLLRAYEPLVVFLLQLLVVVPVLVLARRHRNRAAGEPTWRFTGRDWLLLAVVVAAAAAIAAGTPGKVWQSWKALQSLGVAMGIFYLFPAIPPWQYWLTLAATAGAATLVAAWITLGRCRSWIRLFAFLVVCPAVIATLVLVLIAGRLWPDCSPPDWLGAWLPVSSSIQYDESLLLGVIFSLVPIALWLWLLRASSLRRKADLREGAESRRLLRWLRWPARAAWAVLTVALLAPLLWAYGVLATGPSVPQQKALPEPNGYTQLLALAERFECVIVPEDEPWRDPDKRAAPAEFLAFEKQHRESLASIRQSLDLPFVVPVDYNDPDVDEDFRFTKPYIRLFGTVVKMMLAAGRAASLHGDEAAAVQWYIDTIRLGRAFERGGLLIHWLAGYSFEDNGKQAIHAECAKIPPNDRRVLLDTLQKLGEQSEPFEIVRARDAVWTQNVFGCAGPLAYYIDQLAGGTESVDVACPEVEKRSWARFRILLVELAMENYRDKHKSYPRRLEDLVPGELDTLPLDPFTGRPLCYRPTDTGYLLYSVGENGQDDGGAGYGSTPAGDDVRFE